MKVYFCTADTCAQQATAGQINVVRRKLAADPLVESYDFVSKAEALERMRKRTPELVENLPSNPLPDAFEVKARDGADVKAISSESAHAGQAARRGEDPRRRGGRPTAS